MDIEMLQCETSLYTADIIGEGLHIGDMHRMIRSLGMNSTRKDD